MVRKNFLIILFGYLLLIFSINVYPKQIQFTPVQLSTQESLKQTMPELKIIWNSKLGIPRKIKGIQSTPLALNPEIVKSYFADNFKSFYQIQDSDKEIQTSPILTDRLEISHISLYQKYNDIPVYGVSLKLTLDKEQRLKSIIGKWIPGVNIPTRPRLNQNQVMNKLITYLRDQYQGPAHLPENIRLEPDKFQLVIFNPGIYRDSLMSNYLAYHVVLKTRIFFIDAQTGEILYTYSNIQDAKNRETYNSNDCSNLPGDLKMNESGPVSGVTPDTETLNAHNFAGLTYDYYWNVHGRDSYDNGGAKLVQSVHPGLPLDLLSIILCCVFNLCDCECVEANAAWVPSLNQIVYGDGGTLSDGRTIAPLCNALDVVAHELTHAVTQYSFFNTDGEPVGLDYSAQSGALNESFSDFFAAMIDRDDWLMAEDLFSDGSALRNLADPTINGQPDHMDNYVSGGDVHENCGIPNKVWYLMTEGGIHPHSSIAVTGIGKEAAEKILYRTLTGNKMTQTATFLEAREAALESCEELYPGDAAKYASVWNAFVACGICDSGIPGDCEPYSPIAGREPADIVVLLDYSDSMNNPAESGGRDKIEVLQDAAEIFFRTWELFAIPEDRTDIVFFDSDVSPLTVNLQPLDIDHLVSEIRTRPTGNYTAMGGAMQVALTGLSSGASHPAVILFTNGIQNVNPMAVHVGDHYEIRNSSDAWGGTSSVPQNPGISLASYGIPVHIIGIGEAAATSYHALLNDIRLETGGFLHLTTSPDADLRRFYLEDLVSALNLGTLEMVDYKYATLNPARSVNMSFSMDGAITRAAFLVHWVDKPGIEFPEIRIDGPQNKNLEPTRWVNGEFYKIAVFDFPYVIKGQQLNHAGNWLIYSDESSNQTPVNYQVTLLVDATSIHYDFNLPRERYWTGDPIIITANVTADGIPLTNLKTAKATFSSPRNALGTFLSSNPDTNSGTRSDLLSTRGQSKLLKLLENPRLREMLKPKVMNLDLFDNGNMAENGDSQPGDGIYSAKVIDVKLPGLYRFAVEVEGATSTGWPVKRAQTLSTIVRVKPDPDKTGKSARWLNKSGDGSGTALITIIPYDKFGNYLGPDYKDAFHISTTYGNPAGGIYDVLDGSYEFKLNIPDRTQDPVIDARILGFDVYNGPLSKLFIPHRFGSSIHFGYAIPSGSFNNIYDPNFSFGVDFEFLLSHQISLEALFGYNTFKSDRISDTYWMNLSGNIKYFLNTRRIRPLINGGFGAYKAKGNSDIHFGINGGFGVAIQIKPQIYVEPGYNYHTVFNTGNKTQFSTAQLGFRFRF